MKTLKLGLMAVISIVGLGGAFATANKASNSAFNTFYYAVSNGAGSFTWTTTQPNQDLLSCQNGSAFCTVDVVTGYTPVDGQPIPEDDYVGSPTQGIYR